MKRSLGSVHSAIEHGSVFTDSRSNDFLVSTATLHQRLLFGFSSNFPSSMALSASNLVIGSMSSNVNTRMEGTLLVRQDAEFDKLVTASNVHVRNVLGVNTVTPDPAYSMHVLGDARIEGDLVVNGTLTNVNTNVSISDQLHITNLGTGPALLVNQTGVNDIAYFQDSGVNVVQITDGGSVSIGSNAPLAKLDVQGNTYVRGNIHTSNIICSNIDASNAYVQSNLDVEHNFTVPNVYATNLYMKHRFTVDSQGVVTDPSWIPSRFSFAAQQVQLYGSNMEWRTSNMTVEADQSTWSGSNLSSHITDTWLHKGDVVQLRTCNLNLEKYVFVDGHVGIGSSNPQEGNADTRLRVSRGDITVTGTQDFVAPGDQARVYFGNSNHFIGGTCNVGLVLQVPGTVYPFVLEEMTGNIGLGTMDPEERLHVQEHAKVGSNLYVVHALAVGHSNPTETVSILGNVSLSNVQSKVILSTSNHNLGINIAQPTAKLHLYHDGVGDVFLVEDDTTPDTTPFVIKDTGKVGVGTRAPTYTLDVQGDTRVKDVLFVDGNASVGGQLRLMDVEVTGESNAGWKIDNVPIAGCNCLRFVKVFADGSTIESNNMILSDFGYLHLADENTLAQERLHISNGHAKFDCNVFAMGLVGIGLSNPTESLDVIENIRAGYNVYAMNGIGIGTSNVGYALDVVGDMNITGNINIQGAVLASGGAAGVWVAEYNDIFYDVGAVSVGGNDFSEQFTVVGTSKFRSNVYAMERIGINTSNPTERLEVQGYMKASEGVRGGVSLARSWSYDPNYASWVHSNLEEVPSAYALKQDPEGTTYINASTQNSLRFQISNVNHATLASNGYWGLQTMTPSEVLEAQGNIKVTQNAFVLSAVAVAHSNPTETLDVQGNTKISQDLFVISHIAVAHSNPTETLDVQGNAKVSANSYVMQRMGVAHSNPTEALDIEGNVKVSSNMYTMYRIGVALSNPSEGIDILGNSKTHSNAYVLQRLSVAHSNPTEEVDVLGNAKVQDKLYILNRVAIAHSNPTERLDVLGNTKISHELYTMHRVSVAHSNPTEALDVDGNIKASSNMYAMYRVGVANSNPTEALDVTGSIKASADMYVLDQLGVRTSNPTEAVHVEGNIKVSNNFYTMQRVGIATSNPTETLHVHGNSKTFLNAYAMQGLGVVTSNLTETVDIVGNTKISGNTYILTGLGVATSNLTEAVDIHGNAKVSQNIYVMQRLGVATSNPTETFQVTGNGKVTSNFYIMERVGVSTSNPTEVAEVQGNLKVSSNIYAMHRLGINTSNPQYTLEVDGNVNFTGILYNQGVEYPMSRWSSNYTQSNIWFTNGRVSIGTNTHDELLNVVGGNAKLGSNLYVDQRIGVGLSNPEYSVHAEGHVKAINGTLGPMIMLIPPIAFADIGVGGRLVLDNTLEAGNEVSSTTYRPLFYGPQFLTQDLSTEAMEWNEARFIFRGMALSSNNPEETIMCVQDFHYNRSPQYQTITSNFSIATYNMDYGYTTNATPWFYCSTADVRHLAIRVQSSTSVDTMYRFGSVYLQFR